MIKTLAIATVLVALTASGTMLWALHGLPLDRAIATGSEQPIVLATADARSLRDIQKIADAATRKKLPDHLVNAVLSIEDRRFYQHASIPMAL